MTEFVRTWPGRVAECNNKRNSELYVFLLTENYAHAGNTPTMGTSRNGEGGHDLHVNVAALGQERRDLDTPRPPTPNHHHITVNRKTACYSQTA